MAWFRCSSGGSGGESSNIFVKSLNSSDWSGNKLTIGFKPKKFLITDLYYQTNVPISAIYEEDKSDTTVNLNYGSTNYPTYAITSFCTVNDDGITMSGAYAPVCSHSNVMIMAIG